MNINCNCDMPWGVYLDWLEDQGWDVSELRAYGNEEEIRTVVSNYAYGYGYGYRYGNGCEYENGLGSGYGSGYGLGYGNGCEYENGLGNGYRCEYGNDT